MRKFVFCFVSFRIPYGLQHPDFTASGKKTSQNSVQALILAPGLDKWTKARILVKKWMSSGPVKIQILQKELCAVTCFFVLVFYWSFTCGAVPTHQQGGPPYKMYIGSTFFIHFKTKNQPLVLTSLNRETSGALPHWSAQNVLCVTIFRRSASVYRNLRQNLICCKFA